MKFIRIKWKECSRGHIQYTPATIQRYCKQFPDAMVELKGGGNENTDLSGSVSTNKFMWRF